MLKSAKNWPCVYFEEWWLMGIVGERNTRESVQSTRLDDADDIYIYIYTHTYIYNFANYSKKRKDCCIIDLLISFS